MRMASGADPESQTRRIAIAVDLSDESAYALQWAVKNYLRPLDYVSPELPGASSARAPVLAFAPSLTPCSLLFVPKATGAAHHAAETWHKRK